MRPRWWSGVLLAILCVLPTAAQAGQNPAADEPTVVVRVKSIETVLRNFKLLARLAGREEAGNQVEGLFQAKVGKQGLEGIDPKRPLGAYVRFGKELENLGGAILIPIADKQSFLTLLENLNVQVAKGKGDIYTVQTNQNFDLYLRFANQYAYISAVSTDNLADKNLLDPAQVLGGKEGPAIAATVRLDRVPQAAKFLALAKLEEDLQAAQAKAPPKESPAEREFRLAVTRQLVESIKDVLQHGQKAQLAINLDEQAKQFVLELTLNAQPGTELDKTLKAIGQRKSPFADDLKKTAAAQGILNVALTEPVRKAFANVLEDAAKKSLADIRDDSKRKQAEQFFRALRPTATKGTLDAFFTMVGPVDKHYTLLAGVQLEDGQKVGQEVRELIADALKDALAAQKDKIHLDAATAGGVKVHKFELPKEPKNKELFDLVGDNELYLAFTKDAVYAALGREALATLKQSIETDAAGVSPAFLFSFDVARMAPIIAKTPEQQQLAAKLFQPGEDATVRFVVEGGPTLTARLTMKLSALEYFAKAKEAKGDK